MPANFPANTPGKFVIDIGGQLAKDIQAPAFPVIVPVPSRCGMLLPPIRATFGHRERVLHKLSQSCSWSVNASSRPRALS
jgi:hypothetical protein